MFGMLPRKAQPHTPSPSAASYFSAAAKKNIVNAVYNYADHGGGRPFLISKNEMLSRVLAKNFLESDIAAFVLYLETWTLPYSVSDPCDEVPNERGWYLKS